MFPMNQWWPLLILGAKGQGHRTPIIENGFRTIFQPVLMLEQWNFIHLLTMSQGWALLILGSKGQRSRSQDSDDWKWFPDHIWACIAPIIMKLARNASHEWRMTPFDFGVKRSKVKVTGLWWLKILSRPYVNLYCTYNHETCQKYFSINQGWLLLIQRSKGLRSRSKDFDDWKWSLDWFEPVFHL